MRSSAARLAPLGAGLVAAVLGGCAALPGAPPADSSLASRCERAYAALDAAVDAAGVRDAQAARIAGFPSLRVTRFLASFAAPALDEAAFATWHARLADEDRLARLNEIANLPVEATRNARTALAAEGFGPLPPAAFLAGCASALAARDTADSGRRALLLASARVPDDYDDVARTVGLYPLTRIAFAAGVRGYERGVLAAFASPRAGVARTPYMPPAIALSAPKVRELVARGRGDPLGIPALEGSEAERLLATFAPILAVEQRSDDDRLGRPQYGPDGTLDFAFASVVFGRIVHTRFAGATHLQLVYSAWFRARTPEGPGDPLAGRFDALVWRVTLDHDGVPLVYDAIHGCGCYGLFVTTPRVIARAPQDTFDEQALIPASLPAHAAPARVVLDIEAGTHAVRGVHVAAAPAGAVGYRIGDDDALRSLALPGGGARSVFGPDGFVAGSERPERMLFWPLGIRNAGAMRQWGHHATAFVGRRHFDEAHLLDRYFVPAR